MIRSAGHEARVATGAITPVVADFDDPASLEAALRGVTRAYLVTPSSASAQEQQARFAEFAAQAGVEQLSRTPVIRLIPSRTIAARKR